MRAFAVGQRREMAATAVARRKDGSVMNSVYGLWPMRVSAMLTH